jgi:hypothetical protein
VAAGDLTDLPSVKAWLGITNTTSDAQLGGLITAVSAFIPNYLNRNLLSASYVDTVQGNGRDFMLLRQGPVTAISGVAWQGTSLTTAGDPIAGTNGFYIDSDEQQRTLRLVGYCFPYRQAVRVSYTAGYNTAPTDIAQACIELVGSAFKRAERIDQVSKNIGEGQVITFSMADMNATVRAILAPYAQVSPL